jgi:diguanylate cyclase (GGDEF)-like protein
MPSRQPDAPRDGSAHPGTGTAAPAGGRAPDSPARPVEQRLPTLTPVLGLAALAGLVSVAALGPARASLLAVLPAAAVAAWAIGLLWARVRRLSAQLQTTAQGLESSRRTLGAVLDSTTEGIVLATVDGRIETLNPAAELLFGQLGDDLRGSDLRALLHALDDAGPMPFPTADGGAALPSLCDVDIHRSDGGRFPARCWLRTIDLGPGHRSPHPASERRLLLMLRDLTEITHSARRVSLLEQQDVLTGLLNRKEYQRRMQQALGDAAGSATPHVLCYIDIDQFKVINDTVGHAAGDALVCQLATLLRSKLERAELIGRLGGDEFGVLFVGCDEAWALDRCAELMQTIRHFPFAWRDHSFELSVSIGITAFKPENDSAAAELAKADVACTLAKRDGRNRIHVYRDSDAEIMRHHGDMHLVSTITQALNSGRFQLYCQPIVPLAADGDGQLHHEVLVRMLDEQGGPIKPNRFIPAAEQYILMPAVDRWIISELFSRCGELLRARHQRHPGEFLFAVNLSGTSITDDSFLPYLLRQFAVHRIPPPSVCFEVTETAAIRTVDRARAFIDELAELGCSFALDDFGSGFASYNYLRELPVSYLKIDGSFVHDICTNPVNHALVASMNDVAHVLNLKTIAEWAEDAGTLKRLRSLRVDYAQGYGVGIPIPVERLEPEAGPASLRPAADLVSAGGGLAVDGPSTGEPQPKPLTGPTP